MPPKEVKTYYLYGIPEELRKTLLPFRYDSLDVSDSESDAEGNSESDSNSDSESDYDSESESSNQPKLAEQGDHKSSFITQYNEEYEDEQQWKLSNLAHITGSPFVYFSSPSLPQNKVLAIYKSVLDRELLVDKPQESLEKLNPKGKSAVILVGAGHFSGAIISHVRGKHATNITNPFANINVEISKSFHRYTVRRKQGGAQSASDNAHGKANSAGSNIRRQNEQMLVQEVRELLETWKPALKDCEHVYFRASGRSSRGIIMNYANAALESTDPRVRSIPFATKRPTLDECRRVWLQITKAEVINAPEAPEKKPEPLKDSKRNSPAPPEPQPAKKEESKEEILTNEIVEAIKKSRINPLRKIFTDNSLPWDFKLQPLGRFRTAPTPLLYAASLDKTHIVTNLLQWGADPAVKSGTGQALGDIAKGNIKTKEALQIVRKELGEAKWNWDAAKVGPAMSRDELLAAEAAKKLAIKEKQEKELAEKEAAAKEQRLEKLIAKHGTGRFVGGDNLGTNGLTDQEKQYIERERRARAAEARLARFAKK